MGQVQKADLDLKTFEKNFIQVSFGKVIKLWSMVSKDCKFKSFFTCYGHFSLQNCFGVDQVPLELNLRESTFQEREPPTLCTFESLKMILTRPSLHVVFAEKLTLYCMFAMRLTFFEETNCFILSCLGFIFNWCYEIWDSAFFCCVP